MPDLNAGTYKPIWKNRRRVIFTSLLFAAFNVVGVFIAGAFKVDLGNSVVAQTVVIAAYGFAAGIISSYVFGAVKDDKNFMEMLKGKRHDLA